MQQFRTFFTALAVVFILTLNCHTSIARLDRNLVIELFKQAKNLSKCPYSFEESLNETFPPDSSIKSDI